VKILTIRKTPQPDAQNSEINIEKKNDKKNKRLSNASTFLTNIDEQLWTIIAVNNNNIELNKQRQSS